MSEMMNGVTIDGKSGIFPNTSLDTNGWVKVQDSEYKATNSGITVAKSPMTQLQYRILYGVMYIYGRVIINIPLSNQPFGDLGVSAIATNPKWKLPDFSIKHTTSDNQGNVYNTYLKNDLQGFVLSFNAMYFSGKTLYGTTQLGFNPYFVVPII